MCEAVGQLQTTETGLSGDEAWQRLEQHGPNVVAQESRHTRLALLGKACTNPLVLLLLLLAAVSFATGDPRAGSVMLVMVVLGVVLRFVQEARAESCRWSWRHPTARIAVRAFVARSQTANDPRPTEQGACGRIPGRWHQRLAGATGRGVDTATDIAREAADVILLEKSLVVLLVFNTIPTIKMCKLWKGHCKCGRNPYTD